MTPDGRRGATPAGTRLAALAIVAAAVLAYLPTIDNYFVRDDFGVVQLLAQKPASSFWRWFHTSWMDRIWGFTPDEIRPFPAVSYQITALGGAASPFLHHVFNILLHAANGLLVMAIARQAAALSVAAAGVAGLCFVILPVHTESVAWITGRVDSLPTFFYLASFLAYLRWRAASTGATLMYVWSLVLFFAALFSKQNTITMVGTLVAYDIIVLRRRPWPPIGFVLPYVPYGVLTGGYLWLRYALFGEVAREGALNARGVSDFGGMVDRHLAHVVAGNPDASRLLVVAILVVIAAAVVVRRRQSEVRTLLYFGPVWWAIGVAPVLVAGYSSPRHVYLAAVGWAVIVGTGFELARRVSSRRMLAQAVVVVAIGLYLIPLVRSIREWNRIAAVSHAAVRDVRSAALAAPEGSLLIIGAPVRSWEWALPFAMQPPFVRSDLTTRVVAVSPRPLSCCAGQWFEDTREALRRWAAGAARESALALRWDQDTGALYQASAADTPQLTALARALLELDRPEDLDRNLRRMVDVLVVEGR